MFCNFFWNIIVASHHWTTTGEVISSSKLQIFDELIVQPLL